MEAARRFNNPDYTERARKNLNFILENQRDDGSWLYGLSNRYEAFIDHFHTCFVLKNLIKINQLAPDPTVLQAIHRGYRYYRTALYDADANPKSFALEPRTQIVRLELYNIAEAITLGALLRDEIPDALLLAQCLAKKAITKYQLPDGHFVTRVYLGGFRHKLPFLRWPQSQMFYALTNLWRVLHAGSKQPSRDASTERKAELCSTKSEGHVAP
jgi:hypothetical protein